MSTAVFKEQTSTTYDFKSWQGTGQDAHAVSGSPLFTNSSGSYNTITDFKPAAGSAAINHGVAIAGRTTDAAGNFITDTPDVGPYEYGSSSSSPGSGNQSPTANAGSDQNFFFPANSANLSGSGADPDGTVVSYQWAKITDPLNLH